MKTQLILTVLLLSVSLLAAEGPKVFIDSERYASTHSGIFKGQVSSNASIISSPEIASRFSAICQQCRITIKKEVSDYVVNFAKAEAGESYSWAVYENKEGMLVRTGETFIFNTAIKEAAVIVRAHWSREGLPEPMAAELARPLRIVFYRSEGSNSSSINPTIFCGGLEIAKLTKKKFFAFDMDSQANQEFLVKVPGNDIQFRVEGRGGETVYMKYKSSMRGYRVERVEEETAKQDLAKLKAEESKNVKDSRVVLSLQ